MPGELEFTVGKQLNVKLHQVKLSDGVG